jgi:hypothetical protein
MGPFSRFKYLYCGVLVISLISVAMTAISLTADFLTGAALDLGRIGGFAVSASQVPLWLHFFQLSRSPANGLLADSKGRVFERSSGDQVTWAIVIWAGSCGMLISAFISDHKAAGSFADGQWQLWLGLLLGAFAMCVAFLAFIGKWTRRLVLSKDGISINKAKDGPIRWTDVGDIRFVKFLGQRRIAIDVSDHEKYGLKKALLVIDPAIFNAGADPMMEVFQQERRLNLL